MGGEIWLALGNYDWFPTPTFTIIDLFNWKYKVEKKL